MNNEHILFNKDGFIFYKIKENEYCCTFSLNNNNIMLSQIIDFNLVKLIYDLNTDIYEKTKLDKINDDSAILFVLIKHFFKDLGLPQRYSNLQIDRIMDKEKITFIGKTKIIDTNTNTNTNTIFAEEKIPDNAELLHIKDIKNVCTIVNPHHIDCCFSIILDTNDNIPLFAEKMISNIIHKIVIRVKQFIENLRI